MEGLRPTTPDTTAEYQPMRSCDSDDSQSNASRSEDNEAVPGIIYTSDDSADIGQSDSTYIDSDVMNYIADVNQKMEDQLSQQLLLESSDMASSHQTSPQVEVPFNTHPLSPVNLKKGPVRELGPAMVQGKNSLYPDRPKVHLQVNPVEALTRSNSVSSASSSTEDAEFAPAPPFMACYEPLPTYEDEAPYSGGLRFDALLEEDPIKGRVIHDHLNILSITHKETPRIKDHVKRVYVGDVPIDARYADAFFVKWNWPKIRQWCVLLNLSVLVALLCVVIGLLVHMPKGSDCSPGHDWWQGSTSYHIFVPSFQDSDGDGVGDISGIIARLDYLQGLGVRTVRLASVFEGPSLVGPQWGLPPTNYTAVAPQLGDTRDLRLLAALLHERDMFLVLDVPLALKDDFPGQDGVFPIVGLATDVPRILTYWSKFGVDGFAFPDLDLLVGEGDLIPSLRLWRRRLDTSPRGILRRVIVVPVGLVKRVEMQTPMELPRVLDAVDLIDVFLDLNMSSAEVATAINDATRWDSHPSLPWINWRIGGPLQARIGDISPHQQVPGEIPALGLTMLQLFLPGSVTLYYGDEIGLTQEDEAKRELSWATPMAWTSHDGGFTRGRSWLPQGLNWRERNVGSLNMSLAPLRTMINASQTKVPLYINGIFEEVGSFRPSKSSNYKIRYAQDRILVLDRFYPRRHKYAIAINFGEEVIERDLSKLYYGGRVLASSHDKQGYVRFHHVVLQPREALALVLDK